MVLDSSGSSNGKRRMPWEVHSATVPRVAVLGHYLRMADHIGFPGYLQLAGDEDLNS
jgi:hypothetical protein